ncbi:MAG: glycine zipper 2TM domain-containing protein [Lysobacteraceae bacterium]|jgi:outer membrane lipoprotein SlyB|nr:glycine zipper 2TM domain-containing protein [Xanthomonadaceae bacterium]MCZ8318355.1 glycine zipper 2TM domain-containing protein [Silanimonas sp.]
MRPRHARATRIALTALATALLAACTTAPTARSVVTYDNRPAPPAARCYDCGTVESIVTVRNARPNTGTGAVLGGVVGAIAGRALADDSSKGRRNTATVAGAVAGAVAGNAIEERANAESFDVTVRMDDGRRLTLNLTRLPQGIATGRYVRWDGRTLTPLR